MMNKPWNRHRSATEFRLKMVVFLMEFCVVISQRKQHIDIFAKKIALNV
jgi:hypothetical protein